MDFMTSASKSSKELELYMKSFVATDLGVLLSHHLLLSTFYKAVEELTAHFQAIGLNEDFQFIYQADIEEIINIFSEIYVQVNITGPPISKINISEKILQLRNITSDSSMESSVLENGENINNCYAVPEGMQPPLENPDFSAQVVELEKATSEKHWNNCILGNPDDNLIISNSSVICRDTLLRIYKDLEVDGYTPKISLKGITYLWLAAVLCEAVLKVAKNDMRLKICFWRVGYIWARSLEDSHVSPSMSLAKRSAGCFLALFEKGEVLEEPIVLSESLGIPADIYKGIELDSVDKLYRELVDFTDEAALEFCKSISSVHKAYLLIELANRLSFFGRESASFVVLDAASTLAGISVNLISQKGFRREFQTNAFAMLTVQIVRLSADIAIEDNVIDNKLERDVNIHLKSLDPSNDVLELPALENTGENTSTCPRNDLEYLICLSYCRSILTAAPHHDMLEHEKGRAYVESCLSCKMNPAEYSKRMCLYLRCKIEYEKYKTRDRALLQLQSLVYEYWNRTPPVEKRIKHIFYNDYPFLSQLALELGHRMRNMGAFLSAYEMYKELNMVEECADCLIAAGRKTQAIKLISEHLESKQYRIPSLLCSMGDATGEISYYERAWELTNHRYARAQCSLGKYYYSIRNYEEAAFAFKQCLAINPHFPGNMSFLLGNCYMRMEKYEDAIISFGRALMIDPEIGEMWCNLSSLHMLKKNLPAAYLCISQAIKFIRSDWRVWDTFLNINVQRRDLSGVIMASREFYSLGMKNNVENWVFKFLSDEAIQKAQNDKSDREVLLVTEFFESTVTQHICDRAEVYDSYANLLIFLKDAQREFSVRLRHLQIILSRLPEILDDNAFEQYGKLLLRGLSNMSETWSRWSRHENTSFDTKRRHKVELDLTLQNFQERLDRCKFNSGQVQEKIENLKRLLSES